MSASVSSDTDTVPLIAIHGVGHHVPGAIENALRQTIGDRFDFRLAVSEFNWDQYVDHRSVRTPVDALRSLQRVCANFHGTALAAISVHHDGLDARLSRLQETGCTLLRYLLAATLAALFSIPAVAIMVLLPPTVLQIGQPIGLDAVGWASGRVLAAVTLVALVLAVAIVVVGVMRAVAQRGFAPVRSALASVGLTLLTPLLALVSAPLSVSWTIVGGLVGFFALFGVVISVVEWLLPDVPAYTAWRDFEVAPYLLAVLTGLLGLQGLRLLLARLWYEGPLKILLDIARYVGEPTYRRRILLHLDEFVKQKPGTDRTLVIVAHSLGSIIALDYLCNWGSPQLDRSVLVITVGSPFRRFFLTWLPGVLFEPTTARTVAVIGSRCGSFRWLNVYRPLDYIGTSLALTAAGVGADRSTRQYAPLDAHANYWHDAVVLQTILSGLDAAPLLSHNASGLPAAQRLIPTRGIPVSGRAPHFGVLAAALALFGAAWAGYSFVADRASLATEHATIDARGVRRQVRVSHREIPDVSDEFATAHEFAFVAQGLTVPPLQLSPLLPFSHAQQRVDYRRLEAFVRANCALEHQPRWYESEQMLTCTSKRTIELAYVPGHPQFYLPGFPSQFYLRDLANWSIYPLVLLAFMSIPALPFVILTSALYAVFLGQRGDISEIS